MGWGRQSHLSETGLPGTEKLPTEPTAGEGKEGGRASRPLAVRFRRLAELF